MLNQKKLDTKMLKELATSYETLQTGMTLYRIGKLRILQLSECVGNTYSGLVPSGDRPSARVVGSLVVTNASNTNLRFGQIAVNSSGDAYRSYASSYNTTTSLSGLGSTDKGSGVAIWTV